MEDLVSLMVKSGIEGTSSVLASTYEQFLEKQRCHYKSILVVTNHYRVVKLWASYFLESQIFWVGKSPSQRDLLDFPLNVHCFFDDGSEKKDYLLEFLGLVGGSRFSLVIDDGSYRPQGRTQVLKTLFPRVAREGYIFFERPRAESSGIEEGLEVVVKKYLDQVVNTPPKVGVGSDPFNTVLFDRLVDVYFSQDLLILKAGLKPMVFDEEYYLATHEDVRGSVQKKSFNSGQHHYLMYGINEGRAWRFKNNGIQVHSL